MEWFARKLVITVSLFFCAFFIMQRSRAGGETSGGSIYSRFLEMSPEQALSSNLWLVKPRNIFVPSVSQEIAPKNLCLQNHQIFVITPLEHCEAWVARLRTPEDGKDYRVFRYKDQARNLAYTRNGANEFYCGRRVFEASQMPVRENIEDCVSWSVKINTETKLFANYKDAERFHYESKGKAWSPVCEQWGQRIQQVPTTYKVDFRKDNQTLGTYEYSVQNCENL